MASQRERFAATYAAAGSAQARFNAAADALRAAASERNYRGDPAITSRLDELTAQITELVDTLYDQQERRAHRVLRADELRTTRAEQEAS